MARKPRDFRIQKCTPFYVKGRGYQYRISVTGKTGGGKAEPDFLERVAYDNACKLRDELLSGKKQPTGETFDEFRARIVPGLGWAPSTGKLKDYGYNKWTKSILGPIPVSEINRTKIIYWLTWMRENGATEGVCHAQYWAVHKLLRDAFREDLIAKVPDCADQVKTPEPRDGIALDPDMLPRILALIPPQLTTIPLVQAATGARIGEVLALQPEDFDVKAMEVHISKSLRPDGSIGPAKKGSKGIVPMDAYVLVAVAKHIQVQKSLRGGDGLNSKGGLWSNADGGQLSHDSFKRYWGKARKELKKQYPEIGHIRTHDLRKSMGSWLAEHPEVTLVEGMEVLRHKKLSTFTDYYVRNRPGKRPAIRGAIREYLSPVGEAPEELPEGFSLLALPSGEGADDAGLGLPVRPAPNTVDVRVVAIPEASWLRKCANEDCTKGEDGERALFQRTRRRINYCSTDCQQDVEKRRCAERNRARYNGLLEPKRGSPITCPECEEDFVDHSGRRTYCYPTADKDCAKAAAARRHKGYH